MTKGLDDRWSDEIIPDDQIMVRIGLIDSRYTMMILELNEPEDEPMVFNTEPHKYPFLDWHLVR